MTQGTGGIITYRNVNNVYTEVTRTGIYHTVSTALANGTYSGHYTEASETIRVLYTIENSSENI